MDKESNAILKKPSTNTTPTTKIDRSMFAFFGLLFVAIGIIAELTAYKMYSNYQFTSDGFHYFSALRNFAHHFIFWEGPTFEYMLGNHSYISMYLLTPLIFVAPYPFILALVNVASHFLTGFFIFLYGRETIIHPFKNTLSGLMAILYVTFELVVQGYFAAVYMFQPDYILPPLLAFLMYCALKDKQILFLITSSLIILTKEEYIPLFPIFVLFVLNCKWLIQGRWIPVTSKISTKNFLILLLIIYLISSAISLSVLFGFRTLNEVNHAVRYDFNLAAIVNLHTWCNAFYKTFSRVLPLSPLLLLFSLSPRHLGIYMATGYLAAFSVGRFVLNDVIYRNLEGTPWSNAVVAPVMFIAIICIISQLSTRSSKRAFAFVSIVGLSLCLAWSGLLLLQSNSIKPMKYFLANKITPRFDLKEVFELNTKITKVDHSGYIVTEEYLMAPFMDRSHVADTWLSRKNSSYQEQVISAADYLILTKGNRLIKRLNADSQHYIKVAETLSLICFKPVKQFNHRQENEIAVPSTIK